jgi:hypothetical protein
MWATRRNKNAWRKQEESFGAQAGVCLGWCQLQGASWTLQRCHSSSRGAASETKMWATRRNKNAWRKQEESFGAQAGVWGWNLIATTVWETNVVVCTILMDKKHT